MNIRDLKTKVNYNPLDGALSTHSTDSENGIVNFNLQRYKCPTNLFVGDGRSISAKVSVLYGLEFSDVDVEGKIVLITPMALMVIYAYDKVILQFGAVPHYPKGVLVEYEMSRESYENIEQAYKPSVGDVFLLVIEFEKDLAPD